MASIPMYHGTSTFGGIEAKMARDRMDVLKTEEAEIDLDDYKKSDIYININKQNADIKQFEQFQIPILLESSSYNSLMYLSNSK